MWISVSLETSKLSFESTAVSRLLRTLLILPALTPHPVLSSVQAQASLRQCLTTSVAGYGPPTMCRATLLVDLLAEAHGEQVTCTGPLSQEAAWLEFKPRSSRFASRTHRLTRQLRDTEKSGVTGIWPRARGGSFYFLIKILPVDKFGVNGVEVYLCGHVCMSDSVF